MKTILKMNHNEALIYFLKKENYFNLELPLYFDFQKIIDESYNTIKGKELKDVCKKKANNRIDYPKDYENVNFKLINNKNGEYDWRPLEIIHPILYVDLVQEICKEKNWNLIKQRFKEFSKNKNIECCSIPIEYSNKKNIILNWWGKFEQKALANGLEYKYMASTDITNCYASIYTHAISWAINTKKVAKTNRKVQNIGNIIDSKLQNMNYGQTNGIPQGSTLTDFIAEILLGYADQLIGDKLLNENIKEYKILRYRDDYKIFANDISIIDKILKNVTEILASLNFKLNAKKTFTTSDIIIGSLKKDKIYRLENPIDKDLNVQKKLLIIYDFGLKYPNSGSLRILLTDLYKHFVSIKTRPNSYPQLISIITNIMLKNPSTYGICIGILSEIFKYLNYNVREKYINKILKNFQNIPNSDYLEIWLQRLTIVDNRNKKFDSIICQKIYDNNVKIWNSDWLKVNLNEDLIIDENVISNLKINVSEKEINSFYNGYNDN